MEWMGSASGAPQARRKLDNRCTISRDGSHDCALSNRRDRRCRDGGCGALRPGDNEELPDCLFCLRHKYDGNEGNDFEKGPDQAPLATLAVIAEVIRCWRGAVAQIEIYDHSTMFNPLR
jgi:hypothetical protein